MHSFWFYAGSWMLRVSLLVAVFKLVGTLSWASMRGYGVSLDFWFGFVPHFDVQLSEDRFVRLVTLSTWLGIVGAVVGLAWAFSHARRVVVLHGAYRTWVEENYTGRLAADEADEDAAEDVDEGAAEDVDDAEAGEAVAAAPSAEELIRFDRFTEQVSRRGLWLGAWLGAMTLLITIAFEMFRHFLGDAYVWQVQHLVATCVALTPVIVLLTMILAGRFRTVLPVREVDVLLAAAGIEVEPLVDESDESFDRTDTDRTATGQRKRVARPFADTGFPAALGS